MAGYGDDSGLSVWLAGQGLTLPPGSPTPAVLRQRGSDYVDGLYGQRFPGSPTGGFAQERAWPRAEAETNQGSAIPSDVVPVAVINASYAAAYHEAENPGSLQASATAAGNIKREKTDVLETEYFEGSGDALEDATPLLSAVEGLLAPFLMPTHRPSAFVI